MKYSMFFVIFLSMFFVSCADTKLVIANDVYDTINILKEDTFPNMSPPNNNNNPKNFINNLKLTNFELSHSGFENRFFSNNTFKINVLSFVVYDNALDNNSVIYLNFLNKSNIVSDNAIIYSNDLIDNNAEILIKNYYNSFAIDTNIEFESNKSLPNFIVKNSLTLKLLKESNFYYATIDMPYKVDGNLLGVFSVKFIFETIQ